MKELSTKTSNNGFANSEIVAAIQSPTRIRDLENDEPIKQALRYVFTLIGLRSDQIPTEIEKTVLINFIRGNLKNYAPEEIKIAFELALNGKFEVELNHFGRFSALYLTTVFAAYQKYRSKIAADLSRKTIESQKNNLEQRSKDPEFQKETDRLFDENVLKPLFDNFCKIGKLNFEITPANVIFGVLRRRYGLQNVSEGKKAEIKKEALKRAENWFSVNSSKHSSSLEQHTLRKLLQDPAKGPEKKEEVFRRFCFELTIEDFFNRVKQDYSSFDAWKTDKKNFEQ